MNFNTLILNISKGRNHINEKVIRYTIYCGETHIAPKRGPYKITLQEYQKIISDCKKAADQGLNLIGQTLIPISVRGEII